MVEVEIYKWEGKFFPFKISMECGECSFSKRVIKSVIDEVEQKGIKVNLIEKPWLDNWYKIIFKGAWHAPIVLVNGKVISQGVVVTHEKLLDKIYEEAFKTFQIPEGNHIFTFPNCKFCEASKKLMKEKNISYQEHNILDDTVEMRKFLALVLGKIHPITVPQIFLNGKWVKGYEELKQLEDNKQL